MKLFFLLAVCFVFQVNCTTVYDYSCARVNDCKNSGTCVEGTCDCATDWWGEMCERPGQENDTSNCADPAKCLNDGFCSNDGTADTCACPYGYSGEFCQDEDLTLVCTGSSMTVDIKVSDKFNGDIKVLTSQDVPDECQFKRNTSTNSFQAIFPLAGNSATCPISTSKDESGATTYTAEAIIRYSPALTTSADQKAVLRCKHEGGEMSVSTKITNVYVDPDNFTKLEKNETYQAYTFDIVDGDDKAIRGVLKVGDEFSLSIRLLDDFVYQGVMFLKCTANDTSGNTSSVYEMFDQGCPTTLGAWSVKRQTPLSNNDTGSRIPVKAFKFVNSSEIGILCTIKLCETADECTLPTSKECAMIRNPPPAATDAPTDAPTDKPTDAPTDKPTDAPTDAPTDKPTDAPTDKPTDAPTEAPADAPTAAPTDAPADAPTDAPTEGRKRRSADNEEETVSTVITVIGPQEYTSDAYTGEQVDSTVEECLARSEILAVLIVLASVVCILFIACFALACLMVRKKGGNRKSFEPALSMSNDRFHIPRAHINGAFRDI